MINFKLKSLQAIKEMVHLKNFNFFPKTFFANDNKLFIIIYSLLQNQEKLKFWI